MRSRKGFTLIELMVVIVIVAILAAVVVPMLVSRVERAKTSEGKAIAAQIATALRATVAEQGVVTGTTANLGDPTYDSDGAMTVMGLGFGTAELDGKYYQQSGSSCTGVALNGDGTLNYTILVNSRDTTKAPDVTMTCTSNVSVFNVD